MALDSNRLTVAIEGRITDLEKKMARADAVTSRTYNRMSQGAARTSVRIEKSMGQVAERTSSAMIALSRGAASGLAAAISVQKIAGAAAVYTDLANTLKVAGLEGAALQSTFRDLFDIAQRNGTAIEPLVTLYSRLSQAQGELGASAEDLTQFTDGIALALRVGGTSAEAASGALMQLSQAMGGAVVRAEEFNSINEGARPILQAVADGLEEAGGSVSKLRNLVIEGKLSSEAFFRAFLAGMPNLERQSAKATGTVSQGLTRVNNALINLVGKLDEATGASAQAAENLGSVASSIESMPDFISRAVQKLGSLRSALAEIGNASVWRKLGEFMGIDYSPEGLASRVGAYGYNPPAAGTSRAGSSRRGGAVMAPQPVSTVSIKDAPADGTDKAKKERQNDYERLTQMIQQRTAALNAETAAQAGINPLLDDYGAAVERARAEFDLLQAAQEAGLTITPQLRENIATLANAYADASVAAAQLQESQDMVRRKAEDMVDLGRDTMSGFISDIRNGTSAADALTNALGRVIDKLADMSINTLFDSKTGALGSLITSAFGGAPKFAEGGYTGAGGKYQPAGVVHRGEYVFDQQSVRAAGGPAVLDAMRAGLKGYASGGAVSMPSPSALMSSLRVPVANGAAPSRVTVNNYNAPSGFQGDAKVSTGADGSLQVDVIWRQLEDRMAQSVTKRGNLGRAIESRFGLNPARGQGR